MRHYLKSLIISAASFYVAYTLVPTITLGDDPKNALLVIAGLFIISQVINPFFSFILLPINFLTFGSVALILNGIFIFLLPRFIPGFTIGAYNFGGADIYGFIIPAANLSQIATVILVALIITVLQKILHLIFE